MEELLKKYNVTPVYSSNPNVNRVDTRKNISGGKTYKKDLKNDLQNLPPDEEYDPVTGFVMPTTKAALQEAYDFFKSPVKKTANELAIEEAMNYMPIPHSEWIESAGHNVASAFANIGGQMAASEKGIPKADINKLNPYEMIDPKTGGIAGEVGPDKNLINKIFGSKEELYKKSDEHAFKAAELAAKRKSELSKAGGVLFDLGSEGLHLGAQILANKFVPGAGIALLTTRSYGNASAEARRSGATEEQAMLYGLASAALELGTEKLANVALPMSKTFGKGTLDDTIKKLVNKLATSDAGRRILMTIASGVGEGAEEMLQSALEPVLQRIIYDKDALSVYTDPEQRKEHFANMLYEGLIGFGLGFIAGGGQAIVESGIQANTPTPSDGFDIYELLAQQRDMDNRLMSQIPPDVDKLGVKARMTYQPDNFLMRQLFPETDNAAMLFPETEIRPETEIPEGYALNQEHSLDPYITEAAREAGATQGVHKVLPIAEVEARAMEALKNGVEAERNRLESKHEWDAVDFETSKLILERLGLEAEKTGDYNSLIAWKRTNEKQRTRWGQAGRVLAEHAKMGKGRAEILAEAADNLARWNQFETDPEFKASRKALGTASETAFDNAFNAFDTGDLESQIISNSIARSIQRDNGIDTATFVRSELMKAGLSEQTATNLATQAVETFNNTVRQNVENSLGENLKEKTLKGVETVKQKLADFNKEGVITPSDVEAIINETLDDLKPKLSEKQQALLKEVRGYLDRIDNISDTDFAGISQLIDELNRRRGTNKGGLPIERKVQNAAVKYLIKNGEMQYLKNLATGQAQALVGDVKPKKFVGNLAAYRYLAMLSKGKTTAKNLGGNLAQFISEWAATNVGSIPDAAMGLVTKRRTPMAENLFSKAGWLSMRDAVYKSFLEISLDVDSDSVSKYGLGTNRHFKMSGNLVERFFSSWEKYLGYALTTSDEAFKGYTRGETERRLNKAREQGKLGQNELLDHAQQMALERTFQDSNWTTEALLKARSWLDRKTGVDIGDGKYYGLGSFAQPFLTVPVNLTRMAVKYSPAGGAIGLVEMANVIRQKTNATPEAQAKAALDVGRGMTGTALVALAAALKHAGVIEIPTDDEESKKKGFLRSLGIRGATFNLSAFKRLISGEKTDWKHNDELYSMNYLETWQSAMYMGSMIENAYKEDGSWIEDIPRANIKAILQAINDLPLMTHLHEIENTWLYSRHGEKEWLSKALEAGGNFFGEQGLSFIPNVWKGIMQSSDRYIRNPYDADSTAEVILNKLKLQIPGLRDDVPISLDNWGREREVSVPQWQHIINSNIAPSDVTRYQTDAVADELLRLEKMPEIYAPRRVTQDGEKRRLTADERRSYKTAYGRTVKEELDTLMESNWYKGLSDADKKEAIGHLFGMGTTAGNEAIFNFMQHSGFQEKVRNAKNYGLDATDILIAEERLTGIKGITNPKGTGSVGNSAGLLKMRELYKMYWLTPEQRRYLAEVYKVGKEVIDYTPSEVEMALAGMEKEQGTRYSDTMKDLMKKYG
jgi:hypothetical protein